MIADRVTFTVVCCGEGPMRIVGSIDDRRATGGKVTVWAPIAPPRWQDRAENTIRCTACRKSAQLSEASASAVSDRLAPQLDRLTAVRVTDPDGHNRILAEIPLGVLCDMLTHLHR